MTSKKMVNQIQEALHNEVADSPICTNNKKKDGINFKKEQTTDKHNAYGDVYVPIMLYL